MLFFAAIFMSCALTACVDHVVPHEDKTGDTYCLYKITASKGGGAIPVGSTFCLYCVPGKPPRCKATRTVSPAKGLEYDLVSLGATCTSCPSKYTYELK